ncbi:FkbM family methyltransferase [Crocosphaera sp. Alani8]|uniref:FkbM family methyltransferase n=1 Tax=Crocosphaera sp. Alani8 TaxID=3038952 RepID=UPI00313B3017
MFGKLNRIKVIKDLVVEKLDEVLSKLTSLDFIERGVNHLVENQYVIFTSLIHVTNLLKDILNRMGGEFQKNEQVIKQTEVSLKNFFTVSLGETISQQAQEREQGFINVIKKLEENQNTILRKLDKTDDTIIKKLEENDEVIIKKLEENDDAILKKLEENDAITIDLISEHKESSKSEPDVLLMGFLYSFLPYRVAIDVGANIGNVSEMLLRSGYEVYAFEPYVPTFAKLTSRLNNHQDFYPMDVAIGADDGEIDLYIATDTSGQNFYQETSLYNTLSPHSMPPGLEFTDKVSVTVRSLKSLQEDGKIPQEIGLLKVDAEGYDLEVIRGATNTSIPVIVTEFWDKNHAFAKFDAFNSLKVLVQEMHLRKYYWYIVVARKENKNSSDFVYDVFYYCNFPETLNNSWGNVFFFNEYELFRKALDWCSTMLPMCYFK